MTNMRQLAEQHIREYESHLMHIDELIARADKASIPSNIKEELLVLKGKRNALAEEVAILKQKTPEDIPLASLGPMVIWGIVAQKLEKLIERLGA